MIRSIAMSDLARETMRARLEETLHQAYTAILGILDKSVERIIHENTGQN
jgi:hypothetical protein